MESDWLEHMWLLRYNSNSDKQVGATANSTRGDTKLIIAQDMPIKGYVERQDDYLMPFIEVSGIVMPLQNQWVFNESLTPMLKVTIGVMEIVRDQLIQHGTPINPNTANKMTIAESGGLLSLRYTGNGGLVNISRKVRIGDPFGLDILRKAILTVEKYGQYMHQRGLQPA